MIWIAVGGCGPGEPSMNDASLLEALAIEVGGGDWSTPHRWFVEDRMTVHPEHGTVIDRPDLYEPHALTGEERRRLATHGYRTCRADGYPVCQEALTDSVAVIASIGSAPAGMGTCEDRAVWVGVVTLNQHAEPPEHRYGSAISLTCLEVANDGSVEITSMTPYWIEN